MIVDCAHYRDGARQQAAPMSIADAAASAGARTAASCGSASMTPPTPRCGDPGELPGARARDRGRAARSTSGPRSRTTTTTSSWSCGPRATTTSARRSSSARSTSSPGPGTRSPSATATPSELGSARQRLEARPELLREGPVSVVWAVLDKVVDDYEPVVNGLSDDIEDVEVRVFEGDSDQTERIYFLKREVIEFFRAVHPLLAPLAVIERGADPRGDRRHAALLPRRQRPRRARARRDRLAPRAADVASSRPILRCWASARTRSA